MLHELMLSYGRFFFGSAFMDRSISVLPVPHNHLSVFSRRFTGSQILNPFQHTGMIRFFPQWFRHFHTAEKPLEFPRASSYS